MDEFLMQITLYHDGTIRYAGKQMRDFSTLGEVLRLIAEAADRGAITWGLDGDIGWRVEDPDWR